MTSSVTSFSSHSQWVPNEIRLSLRLSPDSLKREVPFFSLINMNGGFVIPKGTTFTIISADKTVTVQISICNYCGRPKDHIAFSVCDMLKTVSTICSKLNMADALQCKNTAKLIGKNDVSFSIIPSSENVEKKLVKFFSIYDD